jgi:hypothetical protein
MTTLKYPVTRKVLAAVVYRVHPRTLTDWLRDIGIKHNRTLSPGELRLIIQTYELPTGVEIIV